MMKLPENTLIASEKLTHYLLTLQGSDPGKSLFLKSISFKIDLKSGLAYIF
jgi:hypothetical protein